MLTKLNLAMMGLGMVIGYCLCFIIEIVKITRPEKPRVADEKKDPADWWKDC